PDHPGTTWVYSASAGGSTGVITARVVGPLTIETRADAGLPTPRSVVRSLVRDGAGLRLRAETIDGTDRAPEPPRPPPPPPPPPGRPWPQPRRRRHTGTPGAGALHPLVASTDGLPADGGRGRARHDRRRREPVGQQRVGQRTVARADGGGDGRAAVGRLRPRGG